MNRLPPVMLLAGFWLPAAWAQFELSVVAGGSERPVVSVYDFGRVANGDIASAQFRLRNTWNAGATLTLLDVAGSGFTLPGGPALPQTLSPLAAVDFVVSFTAARPGGYSASIRADGVSAQLAAEVVPGLTFQVETAAGKILLGSAVDFGSALVGQGQTLTFDISNQTGLALPVPVIAVSSGDFSLRGLTPAGVLEPGQGSSFVMQFLPSGAGLRSATLTIGARAYSLTGAGIAPDLPKPLISVDLAMAQSALQGSLRVTLDRPAATMGDGTLTLVFQPAIAGTTDPAVAFASGGRTAALTFSVGDTQGHFGGQPTVAFQTGTTAGTLIFTAQVGSASAQQAITIPPAAVGLTTVKGTRSASSVTVQLEGFDNTRTAAALTFSFFDAAGAPIAGPLSADGGPAFQTYFGGSDTGGSFALQAVFPITGDPARIASFSASVANQAGMTAAARTAF